MLKLEKSRIIAAVNKSPLPAEVRKDLIDNADNISKEMEQEIGTYITQLESQ